ncbi:2-amino-4-hydroxy-6-hydroxymethyldihydropteridine diphosphokinase [Paenibacillus thermotolerans]|uniref:2-amino-4-hydroxy-6- hydroxymethyldihydropteridine diphosphokinase n=1 Tax=Paenibacillus thermotolerans TaxID=3027807 RepID=UPI002367E4AD|nr:MULTISPECIES: 2-amino-4-hydroxy-6-hydroxymethyldihydropteridine diphosphokinase [unclassified Paenibacillus]
MTTEAKVAYLGLGSNVGDRERQLFEAIRLLDAVENTSVTAVSRVYETDPVGYLDQPAFLNMACRLETALSPQQLLQAVAVIEGRLGRERIIRWGPRTIDIDILLYDDLKLDTPELTIPHPRLLERLFVLAPLRDVMPNMEERLSVQLTQDGCDGVKIWTTTTIFPEKSERSASLKG